MAGKKDDFLEQMRKQYDELNYRWSRERDKFEADLQHLDADTRKEYEAKRQEYRKYRTDLEGRIAQLEKAGDSAWGDLKDGAESAWKTMSDAFEKAASHFKK